MSTPQSISGIKRLIDRLRLKILQSHQAAVLEANGQSASWPQLREAEVKLLEDLVVDTTVRLTAQQGVDPRLWRASKYFIEDELAKARVKPRPSHVTLHENVAFWNAFVQWIDATAAYVDYLDGYIGNIQEVLIMDAKTKILFFASNPKDVTPLNLDEEIRSITTKIRASEHRDALDLISRWAVRPDDLLQELNTHKPTVVHFSGHGSSSGELVLMDDLRQAKTVSPDALKALFSTLRDNVRLVVLNACYSKTQAEAIAQVIDCVIGMNTSIGDNAAITFAASFYRAIGFGCSVKESF